MRDILNTLLAGTALSEEEARRAFSMILRGEVNESQVGAMLAFLASRGPSLEEIVGGARVMREHVTALPMHPDDPIRATLIDTCGTGGTPKTFNVSTLAAIVAAAALPAPGRQRAYVAKHGGRSRSGRGSAEVLAALGVNIDAAPAVQALCLREAGVCFSFAVNHHPAMKFAAGPRKSLGFPTIFNLLGPLCNPAGASRQLMGVYEARAVPLVAGALQRLGAVHAIVVHGSDGMDEITTTGTTTMASVSAAGVDVRTFDPAELGVPKAHPEALVSDSLERAAEVAGRILSGEAGAPRDIVEVNAAAALVASGAHDDLRIAHASARRAIDSGEAKRTLAALVRLSQKERA